MNKYVLDACAIVANHYRFKSPYVPCYCTIEEAFIAYPCRLDTHANDCKKLYV